MKDTIKKLTEDFVNELLASILAQTKPFRPRGMAALSAKQRSVVAKKAALTRKRRRAALKAWETRRAGA